MSWFVIVCLGGLFTVGPCQAGEKVEDGIYPLTDGAGTKVRLDGSEVVLGQRRAYVWASAAMRSLANDNDRYVVDLKNVTGDEKAAPATVVLMVDGVCMAFHSRIEPAGGPPTLAFTVQGKEASQAVALTCSTTSVAPIERRCRPSGGGTANDQPARVADFR